MATCHECLYQPICDAYANLGVTDVSASDISPCQLFKNKAEFAEVRHGYWIISNDDHCPYCSECQAVPENGKMTKHCPNCGAKMDGRSEV